jgi:hypothetical protein
MRDDPEQGSATGRCAAAHAARYAGKDVREAIELYMPR